MPEIKAAFFDIDGTLLPFGAGQLPQSTVQALAALRQRGVGVYLATGRPPVHLPYLKALNGHHFDGYVTMNGQYCYDESGEVYANPMPLRTLRLLLDYLETTDLSVAFIEKDHAYFNRVNALSADFSKKLGQFEEDTARALREPVYQLNAFLPPEQEADFVRHCPGCAVVRWSPDFCDILPAGGGKPEGIAHMLAHRGLQRSQSIAFGDGGNDITMLRYAGIGVAMGNAADTVKQAADYVTADVTDDGIAKALRHFGLIG